MLQHRPLHDTSSWVVRGEMFDEQGAIVAVDGELDLATAPQLGAVIAEITDYGHRRLVIDLTAAGFLDSTAMEILLYSIAPLREDLDAAVVLAGAHGCVERSLKVSGVAGMFTLFERARPPCAASQIGAGRRVKRGDHSDGHRICRRRFSSSSPAPSSRGHQRASRQRRRPSRATRPRLAVAARPSHDA